MGQHHTTRGISFEGFTGENLMGFFWAFWAVHSVSLSAENVFHSNQLCNNIATFAEITQLYTSFFLNPKKRKTESDARELCSNAACLPPQDRCRQGNCPCTEFSYVPPGALGDSVMAGSGEKVPGYPRKYWTNVNLTFFFGGDGFDYCSSTWGGS